MDTKKYERKHKENLPVVAICYDFDKTLSPDDMQAQGYIQSVGWDVSEFWKKSNTLAEQNDMDQNLAYMYTMIDTAEGHIVFTKDNLNQYGARVKLFPGVEDWFDRIRDYGKKKGVIVEHYIISSGLKEMIEGTSVAINGAFEKIYASSFYYNEHSVAKWPAQVINYTNKTQFLFRIEKGVLDINDQGVNDYFAPENVRVPFRNIVYIGDSDTDIPCMKLVNSYGGHSIGVYNPETHDKTKVYNMMSDNRIKYFVPADYSENLDLDNLVKAIIDRTQSNECLEKIYYECKEETSEADKADSEDGKIKTKLILQLEGSSSFANTHLIIEKLSNLKNWSMSEKNKLFEIAVKNDQVKYVLKDYDVKVFYEELLKNLTTTTSEAEEIKKLF